MSCGLMSVAVCATRCGQWCGSGESAGLGEDGVNLKEAGAVGAVGKGTAGSAGGSGSGWVGWAPLVLPATWASTDGFGGPQLPRK